MSSIVGAAFLSVVLIFIALFAILSVIMNTINLFLKIKGYSIVCLIFTIVTVLICVPFFNILLDFSNWERLIPLVFALIAIILLILKLFLNRSQSGKNNYV